MLDAGFRVIWHGAGRWEYRTGSMVVDIADRGSGVSDTLSSDETLES